MSDEIQDRLDEAVKEALTNINPGVITAWILIAHQANYNEKGEGLSSYPILVMNSDLADHTIRGLLDIASDHVRGLGKWASHNHFDDDEEEYDEEGGEEI